MVKGFPVWASVLIVLSFTTTWATIEVYQKMLQEAKRLYPQAFSNDNCFDR
ncbi:MAG: hypothetical protein R2822_16000 [Spirosomataceae bacterium]